MENQFSRTELLLGNENVDIIKNIKVAVFGVGGVGSYVVEGLARVGVQNFILVDNDIVSVSNINRQLIADHVSIGKDKVEVAKERILKINPQAKVECYKEFITNQSELTYLDESISYIVDAVDNVTAKLHIIEIAKSRNVSVISSMGTGNKLDPTKLVLTDISKTSICPLAKIMRKELKKRNIFSLDVVYSTEEPFLKYNNTKTIGSVPFVPSVAGLLIVSHIVNKLIKK